MSTPFLTLDDLFELTDHTDHGDHNSVYDSVADVRWWKISDAKHRIETGHHDDQRALDAATDRLLEVLARHGQ